MPSAPTTRIKAATAAEVCAHFTLEKDVKALLRDGMTPQQFVAVLIEKNKLIEAIDFVAHALPVREGIWWSCLCLQHSVGAKLTPEEKTAAKAVVNWLKQPTEENRMAAKDAAGSDPMSVAGTVARAVAATGGSMYPPELPFKAQPPYAVQAAVARAVKIASIKVEPPAIAKMQRSYVELGLKVAEGRLI